MSLVSERPLVLLKHSTRCPVSSRAYTEFRRFAADLPDGKADLAIVLVVEDRAVSNEVAVRLGVRHESPQAFVVSKGKVVWHDSHDGVEADRLLEAVQAAA